MGNGEEPLPVRTLGVSCLSPSSTRGQEATEYTGTLCDSEEGKMAWYRREAVKELPCVDDLEELLQVVERDDLSEFMYQPDGDGWRMILQ